MTKAELIDKISSGVKISKTDAAKALDSTLNSIKGALKKGQKITLVGFGTFSVVKRKARKGRNPQTGDVISIPAAKIPKFKAGKTFKESVKQINNTIHLYVNVADHDYKDVNLGWKKYYCKPWREYILKRR